MASEKDFRTIMRLIIRELVEIRRLEQKNIELQRRIDALDNAAIDAAGQGSMDAYEQARSSAETLRKQRDTNFDKIKRITYMIDGKSEIFKALMRSG